MGGNRQVALRKESVDRNIKGSPYLQIGRQSLSARRAWIEINSTKLPTGGQTVALRKESVDRNMVARGLLQQLIESLSARRAWIEITLPSITGYFLKSLSARRAWIEISAHHRV